MIHNEEALRPEYVPRDLYHREGQIEVLQGAMAPLTTGLSADDVAIFGPSGSGKTTVAKYVMERVQGETQGLTGGLRELPRRVVDRQRLPPPLGGRRDPASRCSGKA